MEQTQQLLRSLWQPLLASNDPLLVRSYASQSLDILEDAQVVAEDMVEDYMDLVYEEMEFETPPAAFQSLGRDLVYPRNVTDPISVWERPAQQFNYAKSQGKTDEEALAKALNRVDALASDDISMMKRKATQQSMKKTGKIKGYRRVIHPELSDTGVCGLCLAASDRIYSVGTLLPIHNHCKCEVLPIIGKNDPGKDINLEDLYELAGSTEAADLLKVNYKITQNGELEGYLRRSKAKEPDHVKPPKGVVQDQTKLANQIKALEETMADMIEKARTDTSFEAAAEWQQRRLNKLRSQLNGG